MCVIVSGRVCERLVVVASGVQHITLHPLLEVCACVAECIRRYTHTHAYAPVGDEVGENVHEIDEREGHPVGQPVCLEVWGRGLFRGVLWIERRREEAKGVLVGDGGVVV